ncbi:MAG TPA: hypothetical protein PKE06_02590 [Flavilitoribacter sp.]|nr:hypothetical protein [Flavilitoribacter sp.]
MPVLVMKKKGLHPGSDGFKPGDYAVGGFIVVAFEEAVELKNEIIAL